MSDHGLERSGADTVPLLSHYGNLFYPLFQLALPHMRAYQSDLGHDALALSVTEPGEKLVWGYRESGTHMARVSSGETPRECIERNFRVVMEATREWYLLTVTGKRGSTAEGTIERIDL